MTENLTENQLSQLSDFVAKSMGLQFPRERWKDLERQAKLIANEFGFAGITPFLEWMLSSPLAREPVERLASFLTISETYFWREPRVFEVLRDHIFPELIRKRENNDRHLRLWSAGCATGEEPYSIAIALREALPNFKKWHISLLATDINPQILRKAAAGVYREWSFRNSPEGFKNKYFSRTESGVYEILPEIRSMVTFSYLNLAVDTFPSTINDTNAMDVIFCRNVLMYFSPARARLVGQRLYQCLVDGGWFMVGANELSQDTFAQFSSINFSGAIVYQRQTENSRPAKHIAIDMSAAAKEILLQPQKNAGEKAPPAVLLRKLEQTQKTGTITISEAPALEASLPTDATQTVRELANQGKLAEALATCEKAIAADKLNPGLRYLSATILWEQNREDEAMTTLESALYLDPDFLMAHFTIGNLRQRNGKSSAAVRSYKNVLALLEHYQPDDILPEAEGLTAGRLREIVSATLKTGGLTI